MQIRVKLRNEVAEVGWCCAGIAGFGRRFSDTFRPLWEVEMLLVCVSFYLTTFGNSVRKMGSSGKAFAGTRAVKQFCSQAPRGQA